MGLEGAWSRTAAQGAVETARLLDEVAAFVRSYVVLDEHQADAVALWIANTHGRRGGTLALPGDLERRDAFGKSTLLELLEMVVARPWKVITPTEAVVFRKLDRDQPTLLLRGRAGAARSS